MGPQSLLRVVEIQARARARDARAEIEGAARAAARFAGDHSTELGAALLGIGGAALLAGTLAHRTAPVVAAADAPITGAPKKSVVAIVAAADAPITGGGTASDGSSEKAGPPALPAGLVASAGLSAPFPAGPPARVSETPAEELTGKMAPPVGLQVVLPQELPIESVDPPANVAKGGDPKLGAAPKEGSGLKMRRSPAKLKWRRKTPAHNTAPKKPGQKADGPETGAPDGPSSAPADTPPLVDVENEDYFDAPEPAPPAVEAVKNDGQEELAELRKMRKMRTRDLLEGITVTKRLFCARSRVHDLCEISLSTDPNDDLLVRNARNLLRVMLNDHSRLNGIPGVRTPAQKAYLELVLNGGKMNTPIPDSESIRKLVRGLGAGLVHDQYGHVEVWDVRLCTSLLSAFSGISREGRLDLSFWDTRNVTTAYNAFDETSFDVDVSTWDVSQVRSMGSMFQDATEFNGNVREWDVSNVSEMSLMFQRASKFNGDVSSWDVGRVTKMDMMFADAKSFDRDLSEWNVGSVTSMLRMFAGATLFNSDLGKWDVSRVEDMTSMFDGATSFSGTGVAQWTSRVGVDVRDMFSRATSVGDDASQWATHRAKRAAYGRARRGFV